MTEESLRIIQDAKSRSIFELASGMTTLHKNGKEFAGPCPVCRAGVDRFYVKLRDNYAGCRKCETSWDTPALYAAVHQVSQLQAAKEILGLSDKSVRPLNKIEAQVLEKSDDWKSTDWQTDAGMRIQAAVKSRNEEYERYLKSRCIDLEVADRFDLGFANAFDPDYKKNRPSILIPWVSEHEIYNLKFRFTNERESKLRFMSKGGGFPLIFGEQVLNRHDVLLVTEGELNAISVFQAYNQFLDVLSVGSESNDPSKQYSVEIAKNRGYDVVIGWFDSISHAMKFESLFRENEIATKIIVSPGGKDANDFLKESESSLREVLDWRMKSNQCGLCFGRGFVTVNGISKLCVCRGKK